MGEAVNTENESFGHALLTLLACLAALIASPLAFACFLAISVATVLLHPFNPGRRSLAQKIDSNGEFLPYFTVAPLFMAGFSLYILFAKGHQFVRDIARWTASFASSLTGLRRAASLPVETGGMSRAPYLPPLGQSQIRVLTIYPGAPQDPLEGDLHIENLSSKPAYDALSYTWADEDGNAVRSKRLFCRRWGTLVYITRNCETALRRLRRDDKPRQIWVDSVCINQASDGERAHQVSLMSQIFTEAQKVIAYVGEGTAQSDRLLDWLNGLDAKDLDASLNLEFDDIWSQIVAGLRRTRDEHQASLLALVKNSNPAKSETTISESEIVSLVGEFVSRRWFKRVWVLQEVALPDVNRLIIACGNKETTGARALHVLSTLRNSDFASIMRIFVMLRKRQRHPKHSHLLDVLIETANREATDPKDRIFGVLSIAEALDSGLYVSKPRVDYGRSTQHIYTEYSLFFIKTHGPSFFLSLIKSPPRLEGLPSWAADWTAPWPNYKSVAGKEFAATRREVGFRDVGLSIHPNGAHHVLRLKRPRIFLGYFTRDGHVDGVESCSVEDVTHLDTDHLLIEMYPGLTALLKKIGGALQFIQMCPHALTREGVLDLSERWSDVVVSGEGPRDILNRDPLLPSYCDKRETFDIL
ncbi:HET-domain-containing protein [Thozetella sp. PMI_491]|nr:HET-domain-containing protein [Thozetella sp. PMI_491]